MLYKANLPLGTLHLTAQKKFDTIKPNEGQFTNDFRKIFGIMNPPVIIMQQENYHRLLTSNEGVEGSLEKFCFQIGSEVRLT